MGMSDVEKRALKGATAMATTTEPLAVPLAEATRISGFSRSELYRRASRGDVIFLKNNARILVDYQSLKRNVAGLPKAELRIGTAETDVPLVNLKERRK